MVTLPGHSHDTSGNRGKSGESNPKQIESTTADERKHTQDIAGSNLLKPIQRHRKLMESKVEECHEVQAIVQELKIG